MWFLQCQKLTASRSHLDDTRGVGYTPTGKNEARTHRAWRRARAAQMAAAVLSRITGAGLRGILRPTSSDEFGSCSVPQT